MNLTDDKRAFGDPRTSASGNGLEKVALIQRLKYEMNEFPDDSRFWRIARSPCNRTDLRLRLAHWRDTTIDVESIGVRSPFNIDVWYATKQTHRTINIVGKNRNHGSGRTIILLLSSPYGSVGVNQQLYKLTLENSSNRTFSLLWLNPFDGFLDGPQHWMQSFQEKLTNRIWSSRFYPVLPSVRWWKFIGRLTRLTGALWVFCWTILAMMNITSHKWILFIYRFKKPYLNMIGIF